MDPKITEALREPIPRAHVKQLSGKDYISGQTAIDRLIRATGDAWSFRITNVIANGGHVAMQGEMTIGDFTRTAWGEAKTTGNKTEELFKNAETDTLKRCARLFGVALELYGDFMEGDDHDPVQRQSPSRAPHAPQTRQNTPQGDARPHEPARPAAPVSGSPEPASAAQVRMIFGKGREVGWSDEELIQQLRERYGVEKSDQLSKHQASEFITFLKSI